MVAAATAGRRQDREFMKQAANAPLRPLRPCSDPRVRFAKRKREKTEALDNLRMPSALVWRQGGHSGGVARFTWRAFGRRPR